MTPAATLQAECIAMLRPGDELALRSDAESYPGAVLLAIARPAWACVLRIDAAEYSGLAVLRMGGFDAA